MTDFVKEVFFTNLCWLLLMNKKIEKADFLYLFFVNVLKLWFGVGREEEPSFQESRNPFLSSTCLSCLIVYHIPFLSHTDKGLHFSL